MIIINIVVSEDIKNLKDNYSVFYKKEIFYIPELNFYTFMKIIKIINYNLYIQIKNENLETMRLAIDSIIIENKNMSPEEIIKYIGKLNIENIKKIGLEYYEMLYRTLDSSNFEKDDFKGIIYIENDIDYKFIFNFFSDLKVLFVFNEKTNEFKIIDNDLNIMKYVKNTTEEKVKKKFEEYEEEHLKEEKNTYLNELIKKFLESFFDMNAFFEDFKNDFIERLFLLLSITNLSEEVKGILSENIDEFKDNKNLFEFITDKLSKDNENNKKLKKYGKCLD